MPSTKWYGLQIQTYKDVALTKFTTVFAFQSSKFVEFDWTDPLNLEGCLTEEEVMVRDAAKGYAQVCCAKLADAMTCTFRNFY